MALVESLSIPLGTAMPDFMLQDPSGRTVGGASAAGAQGLLVVFTCNHCPYALAVWPRLIRLAAHARTLKINTLAINPNIHPGYPEDAPDKMTARIRDWGIDFPYLVDRTQQTARDFKAQCTPDIYLFDAGLHLVYHGRIDDNWQDEKKVTRHELQEALDCVADGRPVASKQYPSLGCSIKWR